MRRRTGLSKRNALLEGSALSWYGVLALVMSLGLSQAVHSQSAHAQQLGISAQGQTGTGKTEASVSTSSDSTAEPPAANAAAPAGAEATAEPAGAESAATTSVVRSVDKPDMDAGTYSVRLRDLEQRINELKEQIFRSKARLSLLAETVLQGVVAGAQTNIVHENRMGSSYRLVKVVYALDGAPIFNRADEEGVLGDRDNFDVYNGSIVPGEHTLTVNLEYRGHGYGIFSYLKGYRFKVRSNYTFTAPEGKMNTLRVVAYEKGGPTAPLEERPAIRYVERVTDGRAGVAEASAAQGTAQGGK